MPSDSYRLDHTGLGPTGMGNAPTPMEFQRQQMNRFLSERMAAAAYMMDPETVGAAHMMTQGVLGESATLSEARRNIFSSGVGQAALDFASLGRKMGFIGKGDPATMAYNYAQGIASGGFGTSHGGSFDGAAVSGYGRVTGQGALSEQVGIGFMRQVNDSLYGEGSRSPGKLQGFNAEDASHVFKTLASRGAIGTAAHVEHNASLRDRLTMARDNAPNALLREQLSGVALSGDTPEEHMESLQEIISSTQDGRFKKVLKDIAMSTDGVAINKNEAKRVAGVIKEVTEGMAALKDVYGDLQAPELMQKMESISGMRITNREQAAQASGMVNQLRQAAVVSGIDPNKYLELSQHLQASLLEQVKESLGWDNTNASQTSKVTAAIHTNAMADSAIQASSQSVTVEQARRMGLDVSDAKDQSEIYADKIEGRLNYLKENSGYMMLRGGLDYLSKEDRVVGDQLLQDYAAAEKERDPQKQAKMKKRVEGQMRSLMGSQFEGGWEGAMSSDLGANFIADYASSASGREEIDQSIRGSRRNAITTELLGKNLQDMGVDSSKASVVFDKLGATGLVNLMEISQRESLQGKPKEILRSMSGWLQNEAGMDEESANEIVSDLFGKDGKVKDAKGYANITEIASKSSHGMMADSDMGQYYRNKISEIGASSRRQVLSGENGVSVKSIVNRIVSGEVKGLGDSESVALAVGAIADESPERLKEIGVDASKVVGDLGFGKGDDGVIRGLDKKGMAALTRLHGKSLDLHKKLLGPDGKPMFSSEAELIEATQGDTMQSNKILNSALRTLKGDDDYADLQLNFDENGNATAISSSELEKINKSGELDKMFQAMAGEEQLRDLLGVKPEEGLDIDAKGAFDAANFGYAKKNEEGVATVKQGWNMTSRSAKKYNKMMDLSGMIIGSTPEQRQQLAAYDEDGELLGQLEAQYKEFERIKTESGSDDVKIHTFDGESNSVEKSMNDQMAQIKAAIEAMKESAAGINGASIVSDLHVTNVHFKNDPQYGPG